MRYCFAIALIACAAFSAAADQIDVFDWELPEPSMGGLSGIEVSDDGETFVAISDNGTLYEGRFKRANDGQLLDVFDLRTRGLALENGDTDGLKKNRDSEALAHAGDGPLYVSLEGEHRVIETSLQANSISAVFPFTFDITPAVNSGFEALAIDEGGALYALPEASGSLIKPFPIFRLGPDKTWKLFAQFPRRANYRPVGADFGPDGHLYVLSRAFSGFGFSSRLHRIIFEDGGAEGITEIFASDFGEFDNLEGLSVWTDVTGALRLTMISDDNFNSFQRTQFVEITLQ